MPVKKWMHLAVLMLLPMCAHAVSFSYVQSAQLANSASLAFGSSVTAGHLLIAFSGNFNSTLPTGISDSQGNTWAGPFPALGYTFSASRLVMFCAIAGTTGADTVTTSGGAVSTNEGLIIAEYTVSASYVLLAGQVSASPLSGTTGALAVMQSGSIPSGTEYMVISVAVDTHSSHSWTSTSATIREALLSINMVLGDEDKTSGLSLSTPYSNTYGGGSGSTNIAGMTIMLVNAPTAAGAQKVGMAAQ